MKGCIILYGESFRLGHQGNRNIGFDKSYNDQMNAAYSHISFIKDLFLKNVNISVYLSSYETKFAKKLCDIYKNNLIGYHFYKDLIGQTNLIHNAINNISNIEIYDFVLIMRIDLFLKNRFTEIFNHLWNTIMWPSICFKPHHKSGIHPRVNDMMHFIPKKYYNYLKYINKFYGHDHWAHLINNTDLNYDCLDTMINTFHDSDSCKDFNPIYRIVNRPESNIHHNIGEVFDKNNF